ncbi:MAG: minor capsid protein [Pikeienuella sp.]
MSVNDALRDAAIRHQIGLLRLSNATVSKVLALLERVDARIAERLLREDITTLSRARQERLLKALRSIIESAHKNAAGELVISLEGLAEYEAEFQLTILERETPLKLDWVNPTPSQVIAAVNSRPFQGKALKEWLADLPAGQFARVRNSIRMGVVEGRTTPEIVRDLRGTRAQGYRDGLLAIDKRHAETVVRTAVNHTANAARDALYGANSDLIKGVQWVATLDGRTSAVCRARDGQVYKVGKGPRPPAHPNCRSSTVPVLKSYRELGLGIDEIKGTRFARRGMDGREMNGRVADDVTYDDWLRRQPKAFQEEVLGVKKARAFRKGLALDRFVDRSGQEYTLDELKRRDAAFFEGVDA